MNGTAKTPSIGSREFWRDRRSYSMDWEFRSALAAHFIIPGTAVLDIGCGPHMTLGQHLPPGCIYIPADLYQWTPEVRHVDVDANEFPDGSFGCIAMMGVLEYLTKPELVFLYARARSPSLVLSYCHPITFDLQPRIEMGWVNAFSALELRDLAGASGWQIKSTKTLRQSAVTHQVLYWMAQGAGET